jgi:histidinol dehydrogenase
MQVIFRPERDKWKKIITRPVLDAGFLEQEVAEILQRVKQEGDKALKILTAQYDGIEIENLAVTEEEFIEAEKQIDDELKKAIETARKNIEKFHASQVEENRVVETTKGVFCWRKSVPIEKVGLYVPAGSAPLFSTVLMLAVPAKIAGCKQVIMCSPADKNGKMNPATLYAAMVCGVGKVFKIGGAQAIGAMAFGTESVPRVYKIFGPGNQFVTEAKRQITKFGVAIDMLAGPSEVAVLADETADPTFVASDLLSQAEHGSDSQAILVTTSQKIMNETLYELGRLLKVLPRKKIAEKALENSKAILFDDLDTAIEFLNEYASEHLILAVEKAEEVAEKITNAGSVFVGNYSCESAGDYASGTNHTLPTNGYAKAFSGVSLDSFMKKITFQRLTSEGICNLGRTIEIMAEAEGLHAHKMAVSVRLEKLKKDANTSKSR